MFILFQNLCEQNFGYEVVNSLHVRTYRTKDDRTPFDHADTNYHIKAMIKRLK